MNDIDRMVAKNRAIYGGQGMRSRASFARGPEIVAALFVLSEALVVIAAIIDGMWGGV